MTECVPVYWVGPEADPVLSDGFAKATAIALELHRHQPRKGTTTPYLSHLLAVASLVLEHGGSEDQAIAGLLHDAIEDCSGADPRPLQADIVARFGFDVLRMVTECSDTDRSENKPPWRIRKEHYLANLPEKPADTLLVSLADKVHNARCIATDQDTIGAAVWDRFSAPKDDVLWYYDALLERFRAAPVPGGLVQELALAVARMHGSPRPES